MHAGILRESLDGRYGWGRVVTGDDQYVQGIQRGICKVDNKKVMGMIAIGFVSDSRPAGAFLQDGGGNRDVP
jgi:hypothetical protein